MIMMSGIDQHIKTLVAKRETAGTYRSLAVIKGIDFCSNDYLGLGRFALTAHAVSSPQSGSTGSRLISGQRQSVSALEQQIADFHGYEAALLFSSGYAANSGLLACLGGRGDVILSDELIHASLIDGARLSYAQRARFGHNNLVSLEAKLQKFSSKIQKRTSGQIFVVIESIYSMDGDTAPLAEICTLCQRYGAALIVDEAHAIGVYGQQGRGRVAELGLQSQVFACVFTYGKAVGLHGAVICGSNILQNYLVNFCRPFIYTTAPSPQIVQDIEAAYERFVGADAERKDLQTIFAYFDQTAKSKAWKNTHWLPSTSPIQGLMIKGIDRAKGAAQALQDAGFAVKAIVSPTVAAGEERLRISLHSFNTRTEIDGMSACLDQFFEQETL